MNEQNQIAVIGELGDAFRQRRLYERAREALSDAPDGGWIVVEGEGLAVMLFTHMLTKMLMTGSIGERADGSQTKPYPAGVCWCDRPDMLPILVFTDDTFLREHIEQRVSWEELLR